jgi:hypothetical protein
VLEVILGVADSCKRDAQGIAALAWVNHNMAVITLLQRLTRSILPHSSSRSSGGSNGSGDSGGGGSSSSGRAAASPSPAAQHSSPSLKQLQAKIDELLQDLVSLNDERESLVLDSEAWFCYERGANMRQQLHGFAVSYLKHCSECPATANAAVLEGLATLCVAVGTGLAEKLAPQYSLAAVRAAVAPWMVLLGRLMRVVGGCMRQRLQQVLAMLTAAGTAAAAAYEGLVVLIKAASVCCLVGQSIEQYLKPCWLSSHARQFTGQEQHPGSQSEARAGASSSSSMAAPLLYPNHHLQQPNMPVPIAPGAAGAAGEVAASAEGGSSAALSCLLLDNLDSWFEQQLPQLMLATATAMQNAGLLPQGSSSSMQPAGTTPSVVLVMQAVQQAQLPEQLSAAGLALCNSLPVPWLCNNPDCLALGCVSESVLVGGKGCVCGGCRVAR